MAKKKLTLGMAAAAAAGTAASVPAAQYAGAGAAYHAGARRPGRAVMHAA